MIYGFVQALHSRQPAVAHGRLGSGLQEWLAAWKKMEKMEKMSAFASKPAPQAAIQRQHVSPWSGCPPPQQRLRHQAANSVSDSPLLPGDASLTHASERALEEDGTPMVRWATAERTMAT